MTSHIQTLLLPVLVVLVPAVWAGDCKGQRQVLRAVPGYVTDGPGNYSVNGNCEWLIKGGCENKKKKKTSKG